MDGRPPGGGKQNNNNNASRNRGGKKKRSRGRGRGDNARNKNKNSNKNKNNRKGGPPAPPQTKIVIRNIGDVSKHGSVSGIIGMIRTMIETANQKFVSLPAFVNRSIEIDEASADYLIQEEAAVQKAKEEAEKEKEKAEEEARNGKAEEGQEDAGESEKAEEDNADNNNAGIEGEKVAKSDDSVKPESVQDAPSVAFSTATAEFSPTNLRARLVYIVPPKQTRRRGIKPGCAYLVISGPRIEEKQPPIPPTVHEQPKQEDAEGAKTGEGVQSTTDVPQGEAGKESHHVTIVDPSTSEDTKQQQPSQPPIDYSREVAKGRFLVMQAIEVLEAHAKEDAKAEQNYAGSQVEVALSGKTYKNQGGRRDRREGTLETTADYKDFMEKQAKEKEERMKRPKPAPGGGAVTITVATTPSPNTESTDNMPVAALVEHIRQKRLEQNKRKKSGKKKSNKESSNKEKNNNNGAKKPRSKKKGKDNAKEGGKKGGATKEGKKGNRLGKKKNSKGGNSNSNATSGAAPTLLKPGAAPPVIAKPPAPGNGGMGGLG